MHVTRFDEAPHYHPPAHIDMRCLRLQGHEAGPTSTMWLGVSQILPGGHTSLDTSPHEKIYLVLDGEVTVTAADGEEAVLRRWDSCRIAPGEPRALRNDTNYTATIALAMPLPMATLQKAEAK